MTQGSWTVRARAYFLKHEWLRGYTLLSPALVVMICALAAPGMSAVVEVLLRKDNRLYINDGMYGVFWLLRIDGPDRFPVRAYRNGKPLEGETMEFTVNGPTCDSTDTLPGLVPLPVDIRSGDYLEFGNIGAYSISGRTDYNGFYSDRIVTITSPTARPPAVHHRELQANAP